MLEPAYMDKLSFDATTHTYRYDGRLVPHITEIVPSDYSHVPPPVLERARRRGSAVHKLTELYDLHLLDWNTVDEKLLPYLEAWIQLIADFDLEFETWDIERRLYHPVYNYAGTGDRPRAWLTPPARYGVGTQRRLSTAEIKTIAKMDVNVGLQTSGQQCAENYRARKLGIPETEDRWGFQLRDDGTYRAHVYTDKRHQAVFLSYATVLNWEVDHGRKSYAVQGASRRR